MQTKIIRRPKKRKKKWVNAQEKKKKGDANPQMMQILELAHKEFKITD